MSSYHPSVLHSHCTPSPLDPTKSLTWESSLSLNPHPKYIAYRKHLASQDAQDLFASFDVILDCTDNPASRYLISDAAVLLEKTLISAAALRTDGQLMVLNYPPCPQGNTSGGPC